MISRRMKVNLIFNPREMRKHEHKYNYSVREYEEVAYILRHCKCGLNNEATVSPLKWKSAGQITLRKNKESQYLYAQSPKSHSVDVNGNCNMGCY